MNHDQTSSPGPGDEYGQFHHRLNRLGRSVRLGEQGTGSEACVENTTPTSFVPMSPFASRSMPRPEVLEYRRVISEVTRSFEQDLQRSPPPPVDPLAPLMARPKRREELQRSSPPAVDPLAPLSSYVWRSGLGGRREATEGSWQQGGALKREVDMFGHGRFGRQGDPGRRGGPDRGPGGVPDSVSPVNPIVRGNTLPTLKSEAQLFRAFAPPVHVAGSMLSQNEIMLSRRIAKLESFIQQNGLMPPAHEPSAGGASYFCNKCNPPALFRTQRKLYLHNYKSHPKQLFDVPCGKSFKQKSHAKRHRQNCKGCRAAILKQQETQASQASQFRFPAGPNPQASSFGTTPTTVEAMPDFRSAQPVLKEEPDRARKPFSAPPGVETQTFGIPTTQRTTSLEEQEQTSRDSNPTPTVVNPKEGDGVSRRPADEMGFSNKHHGLSPKPSSKPLSPISSLGRMCATEGAPRELHRPRSPGCSPRRKKPRANFSQGSTIVSA